MNISQLEPRLNSIDYKIRGLEMKVESMMNMLTRVLEGHAPTISKDEMEKSMRVGT